MCLVNKASQAFQGPLLRCVHLEKNVTFAVDLCDVAAAVTFLLRRLHPVELQPGHGSLPVCPRGSHYSKYHKTITAGLGACSFR